MGPTRENLVLHHLAALSLDNWLYLFLSDYFLHGVKVLFFEISPSRIINFFYKTFTFRKLCLFFLLLPYPKTLFSLVKNTQAGVFKYKYVILIHKVNLRVLIYSDYKYWLLNKIKALKLCTYKGGLQTELKYVIILICGSI